MIWEGEDRGNTKGKGRLGRGGQQWVGYRRGDKWRHVVECQPVGTPDADDISPASSQWLDQKLMTSLLEAIKRKRCYDVSGAHSQKGNSRTLK